ncbi:MAG TPA: lytic transglycosylase, partial [Luteimonas sp.]|nr:lytic transglycosylase [Luteimonas sp.]
MTSNFLVRVALVPAIVALVLASGTAQAASRRVQAEIDAVSARMTAAEARYREAKVRIADADPDAGKQADAALADMEDAMAACTRLEGCPVSTLLASYARLLKEAADGDAAFADGDGIDPDDADPDHPGTDS